jgi:hypothetical protein
MLGAGGVVQGRVAVGVGVLYVCTHGDWGVRESVRESVCERECEYVRENVSV